MQGAKHVFTIEAQNGIHLVCYIVSQSKVQCPQKYSNVVYMHYKDFKSKSREFRSLLYYTSTKLDNTFNVLYTSNFEPKRYARAQYIVRQRWKYYAVSNIKKYIPNVLFVTKKHFDYDCNLIQRFYGFFNAWMLCLLLNI